MAQGGRAAASSATLPWCPGRRVNMLEALSIPVIVGRHLTEPAYIVGGYYVTLFMTCNFVGAFAKWRSEGFQLWSTNAAIGTEMAIRRMRQATAMF